MIFLPPSFSRPEPPARRPVYDLPPVVSTAPRWPRLRALLAVLATAPRRAAAARPRPETT